MRRLSETLIAKDTGWYERMRFELAAACLEDAGPQMQHDYCVVSLSQAIHRAVIQWFAKVCGENGEYF